MDNGNNNNTEFFEGKTQRSFFGFWALGLSIFGFLHPVWSVAAIVVAMIEKTRQGRMSVMSTAGFWLGIASAVTLCLFSLLCVLIYLLNPGFTEILAETLPSLAEYMNNIGQMTYMR